MGIALHPNSNGRVRESSQNAGPSKLISLAEGNLLSAAIAPPSPQISRLNLQGSTEIRKEATNDSAEQRQSDSQFGCEFVKV